MSIGGEVRQDGQDEELADSLVADVAVVKTFRRDSEKVLVDFSCFHHACFNLECEYLKLQIGVQRLNWGESLKSGHASYVKQGRKLYFSAAIVKLGPIKHIIKIKQHRKCSNTILYIDRKYST